MKRTIFRARAPLRIGFAGGGTDVSPYPEKFGGAVLNATISLFAYASIEYIEGGHAEFVSIDNGTSVRHALSKALPIDGTLDLAKGVYNRVCAEFTGKPLGVRVTTFVEAPAGSGLGSSSTIVVAMLGAYAEMLGLPLGEYDIARLAWEIERKDLGFAGGKQDQYAATFGGVNFMEFHKDDRVIVNPLRIKQEYLNELEFSTILYYTGISRFSSEIIDVQSRNVSNKSRKSIQAMHGMKDQAVNMKEALLRGELKEFGEYLNDAWKFKKKTANQISNDRIDRIYQAALDSGASGGKLSGAGGGGFFIFLSPQNRRYEVIRTLLELGGEVRRFGFTKRGLETWRAKK